MRIFTILIVILVLSISFNLPGEVIKKISLDDAEDLGTKIQIDRKIKYQGQAAIRIFSCWPTTICLKEVTDVAVENSRFSYRAMVRCENLMGNTYLEMWCHIKDGQYFSRGLNSYIKGTSEWRQLETPFFLKKGQKPHKITLNIVINGKGTVWIDDIMLVTEPMK